MQLTSVATMPLALRIRCVPVNQGKIRPAQHRADHPDCDDPDGAEPDSRGNNHPMISSGANGQSWGDRHGKADKQRPAVVGRQPSALFVIRALKAHGRLSARDRWALLVSFAVAITTFPSRRC